MAEKFGELYQLNPHERMNVSEVLAYCSRNPDEFTDVMVVGFAKDDSLMVRTSNLSRADALYIAMELVDYVRQTGRWKT